MRSLLGSYRHIVVLTGAGVSAASGLPTYRGPGGLWQNAELAALATAEALHDRQEKVLAFFARAREKVLQAAPNAAHVALAKWEQRSPPDSKFTLITQNVDGLHTRAGSRNVVELHGSLLKLRCTHSGCDFNVDAADLSPAPHCPRCGELLRPDVVLFGEPIPVDPEWQAKMALRECDLFVALGTSGTVSPASNFVRSAAYGGARTVLLNLEPMSPPNPSFQEEYLGRAEELLPRLLELTA